MHGFLASTPVGVGADGGPALARAQSMLAATCPQCVNKYAYRVVGGPDLSSACGTKRTCGPETIVGRFRGRADMAGPAAGLTRSPMTQSGHAQPIFAVMHNTALVSFFGYVWRNKYRACFAAN
jgi:hypothetical protein